MEFEKPHRSGTSGSELFICFTSRPSFSSSSSMKMSSKPILSPGRSDKYREPTLSFSSSLSRRHANSMRSGGQSSPMFKKRGCGLENVEPTSPKVTCIGQVRVKTKKQGKKMMSLRRRENLDTQQGGSLAEKKDGECLPHRNQKWVHLPLTICEALSCFLPCGGRGSSCSSRERGEKRRSMSSSCGAVFAKWLMALQEGEEEKRDITVMVEEEEKSEKGEVFDEIEKVELIQEERIGEEEYREDERFSICIPPKNALLLMRCRSEPLRMSALANRFWESPVQDEEDSEEDESEEDDGEEMKFEIVEEEEEEHERNERYSQRVADETVEEQLVTEETPLEEEEAFVSANVLLEDESSVIEETQSELQWGLSELFYEPDDATTEEKDPSVEQWDSTTVEEQESNTLREELALVDVVEEQDGDSAEIVEVQKDTAKENQFEQEEVQEQLNTIEEEVEEEPEMELKVEIEDLVLEKQVKEEEKENSETTIDTDKKEKLVLPDCLLMMLCEPKLSMEVSKETWVCSTDFVQRKPQKQAIQMNGGTNESGDIKMSKPVQKPNKQSSISYPVQSMATMIEQKLMTAVAYEPFVLTRCKSEPLRTSSKLVPEACFWKNRQLEPVSGVGF